jgi:hypothetical protein
MTSMWRTTARRFMRPASLYPLVSLRESRSPSKTAGQEGVFSQRGLSEPPVRVSLAQVLTDLVKPFENGLDQAMAAARARAPNQQNNAADEVTLL